MTRLLGPPAAALLLLSLGAAARAQSPDPASLRGDSPQTYKRLTEADQKLLAGKTADAVDDLQRILDESAGDLISADGKLYRPARWYIHQILAKLPPDALKAYQDRIDPPARKLLDAGLKNRDPAPLWHLLDRYFVSRPAAEGAILLGDILFEQGEFRTAEGVWKRLLPGTGDLTYPGTGLSTAPVAARVVLADIFQGDMDRAKEAMAAFQAKYGEARGTLAGKTGRLADILSEVLRTPPRVRPSQNGGTGWPTFGGESGRSSGMGIRPPAEWGRRPSKVVPLPGQPTYGNPVVANGHAYVTNGSLLCDIDLRQGKLFPSTKLPGRGERAGEHPYVPNEKPLPTPAPSLALAGDRLYVRTGPATSSTTGGAEDSLLVCYSLKADAADGFARLWQVSPPSGDGKSPVLWEGAPLVDGRRMWAAYARTEGGRVIHGIACYDPADAEERLGPPVWAVDVCDSPASAASDARVHNELVTLAGRNVVFCSHTGAVVALEAATGRRAWAVRYPRAGRLDPNRFTDPAPAVAYGGRVFVAPADSTHVLALDPETGELLWGHETAHGARIVGAGAGQVFLEVVGQSPYGRYLRGLPAATGIAANGWQPAFPWACRGLGVVTDDAMFWPAGDGIQCFSTRDGHARFALENPGGEAGNLVYADGMLVMATAKGVVIYRSQADDFGRAGNLSPPSIARLRFLRLVARAEQQLAEGHTDPARTQLLSAARSDLPAPYRAWIAARLLLLTPPVGDESALPADLRSLLTAELRTEWLLTAEGDLVTLETLLHRRLGRVPGAREPPARARPPVVSAIELGPVLELDRSQQLPSASAPLLPVLGSFPRHLYLAAASDVVALSASGGEKMRYAAVDRFTHAGETADGLILAGPLAVALYGTGRSPVWTFRVPISPPLPSRAGDFGPYSDAGDPLPELSDFQAAEGWLLARLGPHHLIAFDLRHCRVAWVRAADGTAGLRWWFPPDAPRFGAEFSLGTPFTVAQVSKGRRWVLETETGRLTDAPPFTDRTAAGWWQLAPTRIGDDFIVADGPGQVRRVNLHNRQVKWTSSEPKRESSLSGEPAQIRAWGDVLMVAVHRNYGVEVFRLNTDSGRSLWRDGPVFLDDAGLRLADADCDGERLYLRVGNTLRAIELLNGKTAWEVPLPDTHGVEGWAVRTGRNGVIAHPRAAVPRDAPVAVWGRLWRSFVREPSGRRLPAAALGLYDAWVARSLPVLAFDPESGRELGRLDLPARGPAVVVCFDRDRAVVGTGSVVAWIK